MNPLVCQLRPPGHEPDDLLHDESPCEYEEEGGEVEGQPGREVIQEAVVGQEDQADQDEKVESQPTAPNNNKYSLLPVKTIILLFNIL